MGSKRMSRRMIPPFFKFPTWSGPSSATVFVVKNEPDPLAYTHSK